MKLQTQKLEAWITGLLPLLALAWILREILVTRPGFDVYDEIHVLHYPQLALEGITLPVEVFTGSITKLAQYISVTLLGSSLLSLRLPIMLALIIEHVLLWKLVQKLWGSRSARAAVLISACAAMTLIRGRTLLSFSMMPMEILLVLWLWSLGRRWAAFGASFFAVMLALDYEGIFAGWLCLGTALAGSQHFRRKALAANFAGAMTGLVILAMGFGSRLTDWFFVRSNNTLSGPGSVVNSFEHMMAYLYPASAAPYLGPQAHAAFPPWAFIFLFAGVAVALKKERWLPLAALVGMVALVPQSAAAEPNRAIATWPFLAMLAGLGWTHTWDWMQKNNFKPALLLLLPLAGIWIETTVTANSLASAVKNHYGWSQNLLNFKKEIEPSLRDGRLGLVTRLSPQASAARFILGPATKDTEPVVGLFPQTLRRELDPGQARFRDFGGDQGEEPLALILATGQFARRLLKIDQDLAEFEQELPLMDVKERFRLHRQALQSDRFKDPLLRAVLWRTTAVSGAVYGLFTEEDFSNLQLENFKSVHAYFPAALYFGPGQAELGRKMKAEGARREPELFH